MEARVSGGGAISYGREVKASSLYIKYNKSYIELSYSYFRERTYHATIDCFAKRLFVIEYGFECAYGARRPLSTYSGSKLIKL